MAPAPDYRKGTCRLCFEEGGKLIAPCLCKGTSKWIHRDCLNKWRVNGSNPRALTNCCECGFQYHLELHRDEKLSTEGEQRRRQLMRRLGSQTILWFLLLQVVVCGIGILIRLCDPHETLVAFFNFPQLKGHEHVGSFLDALKFHKLTYYVSAVLVCLALTGMVVSVFLCFGLRSASPASRHAPVRCECDVFDAYACSTCCEDCGRTCAICGDECCHCRGASCADSFKCDDCGGDAGGLIVLLLLVVLAVLVLIGIFAAVMALVAAVQKAVQEFAKIQQMRLMAEEYVVRDLADPSDLGDGAPLRAGTQDVMPAPSAPPLPPRADRQALEAQASIERELAEMHGRAAPTRSFQALHNYGSASPGP